jgi:hypothetical protein
MPTIRAEHIAGLAVAAFLAGVVGFALAEQPPHCGLVADPTNYPARALLWLGATLALGTAGCSLFSGAARAARGRYALVAALAAVFVFIFGVYGVFAAHPCFAY